MQHFLSRTRVPPRILRLGPWGMIAAGLIFGTLAARSYLRHTKTVARKRGEETALAQWDTDGGSP